MLFPELATDGPLYRAKHSSAAIIAPALAPVLDRDNAAEAAIAGGGFAGLASTIGAPYTWGPEYEMARTEAQLKEYRELLKNKNVRKIDKAKAILNYYNPVQAYRDHKAKVKALGPNAHVGKAAGKAFIKSYARSGLLGLGGAALAAGYTRYGDSLLGDNYVAPSSLFSSDDNGMQIEAEHLAAAAALAMGAGAGYYASQRNQDTTA